MVNSQIATKEAEWQSLYSSLKVTKAERAKAALDIEIQRIESQLAELAKRQADLSQELAHHEVSEAEMVALEEFADQVRKDFDMFRKDFESRRLLIERLNIQASFCVEDGQKVIYVTGKITPSAQRLLLASNTTCGII